MEDDRPFAKRLLARLPFVRTSLDEDRPALDSTRATKSPPPSPTAQRRQRKGSLRTTLLTTGHILASSQPNARQSKAVAVRETESDNTSDGALESHTTPAKFYGSSTDEDSDGLTLAPRATSEAFQSVTRSLSGSGAAAPLRSRRKSVRTAPPLLSPPSLSLASTVSSSLEDLAPSVLLQHDYSETEWWGWIILLATWIVFVVGMGSCLGVWSWAWDVGETPYAPPELEDDPTLPMIGYYPALIVMTGVMAWVWVIIAWVGMKYFRHAKVWDGEEY